MENEKICIKCNQRVEADAKFCPFCGSSEFQAMQPENTGAQPSPGYVQPQPPVGGQPWQPPVPQNPPRKKKTGLIVGIVAAVLLVLAGIGFTAEKLLQKQEYDDNDGNDGGYSFQIGESSSRASDSSAETSEKADYSKGVFDGSVYVNEWADIQFALPEGFSNADAATYSSAESENTECGVYYQADDTMSLVYIAYEKLPEFPVYDEEDYLDAAMGTLKSVSGLSYINIPDTYSTATIGGYAYAKAECSFNNGNGDFANTFYVRKLDNYMICISAISVNAESNDVLVGHITNVK